MKLLVNGSSSSGNQYLLISKDGTLALEAGVPLKTIQKATNFLIENIDGVLLTHEHGDHAKYAREYSGNGIDVYSSKGTLDALVLTGHRTHEVYELQYFMVGTFKVMPFKIKHDAAEPFGYLIQHQEMGTSLFLTDTWFCPYKFKGLNQLIIECNFSDDILEENLMNGAIHPSVVNRVKESHMSLDILKDLLSANDLSKVNNIVLIHLSSQNSDAKRFQREITELTGKKVSIADKGLEIEFSLTPF